MLFAVTLGACLIGALVTAFSPTRYRARVFGSCLALESLLALALGIGALGGAHTELPLWSLGPLGQMRLALDPLSGLFVVVSAAVFLISAPYTAREADHAQAARGGQAPAIEQVLLGAMILLLAASDVVSLLLSWELASLLIYALVLHGERATRERGAYLMLALGEAGMVAALIGLLLLARAAEGLDFAALRDAARTMPPDLRSVVFLLTFFGFGVKAGLAPFNQWLAPSYAAIARGLVPVIAGATTNLGIYAVLRVDVDLLGGGGVGPGLVVLATGAATALIGILYATIEPDLKRMLAHSSIENMGIITAVLGAAMVFMSSGHPVVAAMALVAALYHLVNHSTFKTLLYIGGGAVERLAGSRDMDRLGGLLRGLPWTGLAFLIGALGIAALPPFNGFVSEWLALQSLLRAAVLDSIAVKMVFAVAGAALALTAGLAMTCFVKAFAMSFLGMARSEAAARAHGADIATGVPLAVLALLCVALGIGATRVIPVLDNAVWSLAGAHAVDALVPPFFDPQAVANGTLVPAFAAEFHDLGAQLGQGLPVRGLVVLHRGGAANPVVYAMSTAYTAVMLVVLLTTAWAVFRVLTHRRHAHRARPWDGGLSRLRPGATYTATGFSNPVRVVFDAVLRPRTSENTTRAVAEHFRTAIQRERIEVHLIDRLVLHPGVWLVERLGSVLRGLHTGPVNRYAAFVLLTVLAALATTLLR